MPCARKALRPASLQSCPGQCRLPLMPLFLAHGLNLKAARSSNSEASDRAAWRHGDQKGGEWFADQSETQAELADCIAEQLASLNIEISKTLASTIWFPWRSSEWHHLPRFLSGARRQNHFRAHLPKTPTPPPKAAVHLQWEAQQGPVMTGWLHRRMRMLAPLTSPYLPFPPHCKPLCEPEGFGKWFRTWVN